MVISRQQGDTPVLKVYLGVRGCVGVSSSEINDANKA